MEPKVNFSELLAHDVFQTVGSVADRMERPCYVVGGYVRDLFLQRPSKDIDFVTVGSGIEVAEALGKATHRKVNVFRAYGTAQVKWHGLELEFVGARKESYNRDSRNPIVEDGTLEEDIARRDFTINAMALCINAEGFGNLIDYYHGLDDLDQKIIRTPLDPDITFSDDPLRMMRAVRFATQLDFTICPETFDAICRNAERIAIIKRERIKDELQKIMRSPRPSIGWKLLLDTGLLKLILPELAALKGVELVKGRGHKDNFYHTVEVLDNVARATNDEWTRWAALFHDIAKPVTKRWDDSVGWTFHNHNFVGAKMIPKIFASLTLPMGSEMRKVQKLVELHMRPIALVEDEVTDSAVRRLLNYAENDIEDLMILARADITSKNVEKKKRLLENFDIVDRKFGDIRAIDKDRAFRPALNGHEIMEMFGLTQSPAVGFLMQNLTRVSKDCEIGPSRNDAVNYLIDLGSKNGLIPNPAVVSRLIESESDKS